MANFGYTFVCQDAYLVDHVIDGRILYPFTGYLVLAWRAACYIRGLHYLDTPVIIEDANVYRATVLTGKGTVAL